MPVCRSRRDPPEVLGELGPFDCVAVRHTSIGKAYASEMIHREDAQASVDQLFEGFLQARDRVSMAVVAEDPIRLFFGLFETLNWTVALADAIAFVSPSGEKWWRDSDNGFLIMGVRYARNRVHHQWANALQSEIESSSVLPFKGRTWVWRELEDLPSPSPGRSTEQDQDIYRYMRCSEPRVTYTLADLEPVLRAGLVDARASAVTQALGIEEIEA